MAKLCFSYPAWWLKSADVGYTGATATGANDSSASARAKQCVLAECAGAGKPLVELDCVMRCLPGHAHSP